MHQHLQHPAESILKLPSLLVYCPSLRGTERLTNITTLRLHMIGLAKKSVTSSHFPLLHAGLSQGAPAASRLDALSIMDSVAPLVIPGCSDSCSSKQELHSAGCLRVRVFAAAPHFEFAQFDLCVCGWAHMHRGGAVQSGPGDHHSEMQRPDGEDS